MGQLLVTLTAVYLATTSALLIAGRQPTVPIELAAALVILCLPFAATIVGVCMVAERVTARPWLAAGCVALGLAAVPAFRFTLAWLPLAFGAVWFLRREIAWRTFVPTLALAMLAVAIGYGGVWNANILAAAAARAPLGDDLLRRTDLWLYDAAGLGASYDGLFPIVRVAPIFSLLEAGYLMAFPELLTVLIYLTLREPERLSRAVAVLFATYGAALLVFVIFPTAGPCVVYPQSLAPAFRATQTGTIMALMASSFTTVREQGGVPDVAYFVALPSLHVAVGLLLALLVRRCRPLFWMLAPMSTLVVASTFLLGYHYVLDAVAAVPLAWAAAKVARSGAPPRGV